MSRVGKKVISIPKDVTVDILGDSVKVSGKKAQKELRLHPGVRVIREGDVLKVELKEENGRGSAIWGTMRAQLANMVEGVSQGFEKVLELHGLGYRANLQGNVLRMTLGMSHPVSFELPEGVGCNVLKDTVITLSGSDKNLVGQTAARIRSLRPPDVYKNKGVRYRGERLRKKAGKSGASGKG